MQILFQQQPLQVVQLLQLRVDIEHIPGPVQAQSLHLQPHQHRPQAQVRQLVQ